MILISGGQLAELAASAAHYVCEIPVVTVTGFEGAAKVLYRDVFAGRYQEAAAADSTIGRLVAELDGKWEKDKDSPNPSNERRAENIVSLTERLYRFSELSKPRSQSWNRAAGAAFVVLTLWILLFTLLCAAPPATGQGTANATPQPTTQPAATAASQPTTQPAAAAASQPTTQPAAAAASQPTTQPTPTTGLRLRDAPLFQPIVAWFRPIVAWFRPIVAWFRSIVAWFQPIVDGKFLPDFLLWIALSLAAMLGALLRKVIAFRAGEVTVLEASSLWSDVAAGVGARDGARADLFLGGVVVQQRGPTAQH